jgi:hypothetical protein
MASAVLEVRRMKKILSKKLQLRSTTIAILTGPGLRAVKGGTDIAVDDDGGVIVGTGITPCEPAGNGSRNDPNTNPHPCHVPITEAGVKASA